MEISFNKVFTSDNEINYISQALASGKLSGNYSFNKKVKNLMRQKYNLEGVFLTPSCTAALEMGALLAGIEPGDEVIMPSFTFSSTANSVLIFGAKPVFCEIRSADMNIDVTKIEALITEKTKMIIPIDYGGVPCDIDPIMKLADKYNLIVMQDCAQSYGAFYRNEISGKKAHLACYSFHDTKNITCGEGGALVVNKEEWRERASFLMEKGTDRSKMLIGLQDKYSWVDKGSSYLLSDLLAAMLLAQLEQEDEITRLRKKVYDYYVSKLTDYEQEGYFKLPKPESFQKTNYHCFWILFNSNEKREYFINNMAKRGVPSYISYIPLHSSKMGKSLGYDANDLPETENLSSCLARLPIYPDLSQTELKHIFKSIREVIENSDF